MSNDYTYDVFLSHSSKDKPVVRDIAARLTADGVRVWLDDEQIKPGDSIPVRIEEGLEHSRVLLLCMSANAFGSDWAGLESNTFRFRDPLNKDRRFIPLRLDDTPIKGSLAQFLHIKWLPGREQEYAKLLEACRNPRLDSEGFLPFHFHASTKHQDNNLIAGYAEASLEDLLTGCNQMIHCLAGFDTIFLMSPQCAAEQAHQIGDEWLNRFNHAHEILCLAATARRINFQSYKQLVNSAYTFWQEESTLKDTETDLKRLYSHGITELHDLKRALMVEIATVRAMPPAPEKDNKASIFTTPHEFYNQNGLLTRVEINKLVNRYIGVNGGYLGDFNYRTHHDFYLDLDLDLDPYNLVGTTRERFIKILAESPPDVQARILEGILNRFPAGSSELRTQTRCDEIAGWIVRLRK